MSYLQQIAALKSSSRSFSITFLVFSSAEDIRRVQRLIFLTTSVTDVFFFFLPSHDVLVLSSYYFKTTH
jgi:hypothetical protein